MIEKFDTEKHDPSNIINLYSEHEGVKAILNGSKLSVFDLGCGVPQFLFYLYHEQMCFEKFIGVDYIFVGNEIDSVKYDNLYHYYTVRVSEKGVSYFNKRSLISEQDFNKIITLHFGTYIDYFLKRYSNLRCDYMIMANMLHLNRDETIEIFYECEKRLNKGGLIYVRVNHEDNVKGQAKEHYKFNEENFINLFEGYDQVYFNSLRYDDVSHKECLLYFGVKK